GSHPDYAHRPEPYWELVEEGMDFSFPPVIADFVVQLERSIATLLAGSHDTPILFDRCPVDFVAYLDVLAAAAEAEWTPTGRQLAGIEKALASLDLVVFVPLQVPDEIGAPVELPVLRRSVDARLRRILGDDELGLFGQGPEVVEIAGPPAARAAQM